MAVAAERIEKGYRVDAKRRPPDGETD